MRRLSLLALVLVGLALRLAFLSQPMRQDEAVSYVLLSSQSLRTCVTVYLDANNHPLHSILVHLSALSFGKEPWSLRMPSFVAGVLLIPATYAAFREVADRTTGLLAAALVVPSAPLLEYSTNARGYSLETLFFVLLLFASARVLRDDTILGWISVALLGVLGFYTIPTMLIFFSATVVWMLASALAGDVARDRRGFVVRLVGTCACVAVLVFLLYLPFIRTSGLASLTQNRWVHSLSWAEVRAGFAGTLWDYAVFLHRGLPLVVALPLVASFVVSLVVFRHVSTFRVSPVLVIFATYLAFMAVQRILPPERVFVPCVPIYLGSCAVGLRWVAGRLAARARERVPRLLAGSSGPMLTAALAFLAAGVPGALVLGNGAAYQNHDQVIFSDAEPIALLLQTVLRKGDIVYAHRDAGLVLRYYFELHRIPLDYLYGAADPPRTVRRVFVIDASKDYFLFTFQHAIDQSNLPRSKNYRFETVAELPSSTIFRVLEAGG